MICHTSDPKDCYPKIFQPTDEFQIVRDDQQLPNGLHVRMNIWTGQKEAKINVPDEVDPSLEGLPVDHAIAVVEPEQGETPQIPKGAPAYDSVGKIKGPQQDAQSFLDAMRMLKSGVIESDKEFDSSLEALEDISHDIYYGLKTAEDVEVMKALFCLMEHRGVSPVDGAAPRDQQAAAIIASALQNNPSALKEVVKNWNGIMATQCPGHDASLLDRFHSSFVPASYDQLSSADASIAAAKAKAKVSAINGLIRDPIIRKQFLSQGGMDSLQQVLLPEGKEWATAQRRVGQLALDNFLDEDMGANIGEWPTAPRAKDTECRVESGKKQPGCWDYHVERIMKTNKKDKSHWSRDLHNALAASRKRGVGVKEHVDL